MATITIELNEDQAAALAQFCKRAGFSSFQNYAKSDEEAWTMQDAIGIIEKELNAAGYNPR